MRVTRLFVLMVSACGAAAASAGPDYRPFTVPWGDAAGAVGRETGEAHREWTGPASVRIGRAGDVLVVDTIGHRVQRYAPDGKHLGAATFPAATPHDAVTVAVDVAEDRAGDLNVLELATRAVVRVGADGARKPSLKLTAGSENASLFTAVALDAHDNLMVFDGFANRVVRVDRGGKLDPSAPDLVDRLAPDADGRLLAVELGGPDDAKRFHLRRVDAAGKKEPAGTVALARPANELHLIGADRAGRVYVEVAYGGELSAADREVLVLSKDAAVLERFAVPVPPTAFKMTNARAVLPEGGVLVASEAPEGLQITPHGLSKK